MINTCFGAYLYSAGTQHGNFIIIIINPLTARVVGAPQMISQPVFSIFPPALHCPLGLDQLQACPFPDVVFVLPTPLPKRSVSHHSPPPRPSSATEQSGQQEDAHHFSPLCSHDD